MSGSPATPLYNYLRFRRGLADLEEDFRQEVLPVSGMSFTKNLMLIELKPAKARTDPSTSATIVAA